MNNVIKKESRFIKKLEEINSKYNCFSSINSAGLWISVEMSSKKNIEVDKLIKLSHRNGLMVLKANSNTIRFSPSLLIENELIDRGLDLFEKSILDLL